MNDPKWKQFEKLGERIFKELSSLATVRWNDSIHGHDSGIERQIDISIRTKLENHEILEIIQLKNWKYKADINAVGEFASVVKDVKASSGILVCKSGFTAQAKKYARNIGIKLLNLHDAESRDWNQEIKIPVLWIEYVLDVEFSFVMSPKYSGIVNFGKKSKLALSPDEGKSFVDPMIMFTKKWNNWEIDKTPNKTHEYTIPQKLAVRSIMKNGFESWVDLDLLKFIYKIERKNSMLGDFKPKECRGIIDYHNDDAFIASHLPPLDELPKNPKKGWQKIEDPDKIAVNIKTTLLTVEKFDRIKTIGVDKMFIKEFKKINKKH